MQQDRAEEAARRLSDHLGMTAQAGWTGLTTGPEPQLIVNLYKELSKHWPTVAIPPTFADYAVRVWKTGRPRPAI